MQRWIKKQQHYHFDFIENIIPVVKKLMPTPTPKFQTFCASFHEYNPKFQTFVPVFMIIISNSKLFVPVFMNIMVRMFKNATLPKKGNNSNGLSLNLGKESEKTTVDDRGRGRTEELCCFCIEERDREREKERDGGEERSVILCLQVFPL